MILKYYIDHWRQYAPWPSSTMVEQDLIISRALVCLYEDPELRHLLLFRGGTALNKLYIQPAARYSEDIDFVQKEAKPIGKIINLIRSVLDSWLGLPKRKFTERGVKLIYRYQTIDNTVAKLKVEINTTEHFNVLQPVNLDFKVESKWFSGNTKIHTYSIDELMATKDRALYQRKKGRDLFDVAHAIEHKLCQLETVVDILERYCCYNKAQLTRAMFEKNFYEKQRDLNFKNDITGLLPVDYHWDFDAACELIWNNICPLLLGESWKNR